MGAKTKALIAVVVLAAAVGVGILLWPKHHDNPKKSDCEIVSEMLFYNKKQIAAMDAVVDSGGEWDEARYRQQSQDLVTGLQDYVDQLLEKSIQAKAQKIVDATAEHERIRQSFEQVPLDVIPPPGQLSPAQTRSGEELARYAKQQQQNLADLRQSCPTAGGVPSPL